MGVRETNSCFAEEGLIFRVNRYTNILPKFINQKRMFVKTSAFIVVSGIVLAIAIHASVLAIAGHGLTSSHQGVQSPPLKAPAKQRPPEPSNALFPLVHVAPPSSNEDTAPIHDDKIEVTPIPTPTPTPTKTSAGGNPSGGSEDPVTIIRQVFGAYADQAIRVARCESGLNPAAQNPYSIGGSYATGLFQILYPSTWSTTPQANLSPFDARANTQAAYHIFSRDGYSWRQWSCAA
jgi:hypothetical protein